jgi:hypothetical protein
MSDATALRKKWEEEGNKPCIHPEITKEYYLGAHTMDYVCAVCGEEFSLDQKKSIEQNRAI